MVPLTPSAQPSHYLEQLPADGDFEMLEWTTAGDRSPVGHARPP